MAQVSHFVLRLAHCRGTELRRWFLAQEGELFAARFREEPGKVSGNRGSISSTTAGRSLCAVSM